MRSVSVVVLLQLLSAWGVATVAAGDGGLKVVMQSYRQCEATPDVAACLKLKAARALQRALEAPQIPVLDGVTLVKVADEPDADAATDAELSDAHAHADSERLDELLLEQAARFLRTHSVQLSVPRSLADNLDNATDADTGAGEEEGRRRRPGIRRYGGALLMALLMKGGLMAMAYKGVAILAGKALLVAKMALVISVMVALKKLLGGGGEEKVTYEIVKTPHISHAHDFGGHYEPSGGGGGHYRRSVDLAYRAHQPVVGA